MTRAREINFDMDGTIANLYGVDNWLEYIIARDTKPYEIAKPLLNLQALARVLNRLQKQGYTIRVISWLAKNATTDYDNRVTEAKKKWLATHLASVKWDEICIVKYGTPKSTCGNGILFDDEAPNREEWKGQAYDVQNIIEILRALK